MADIEHLGEYLHLPKFSHTGTAGQIYFPWSPQQQEFTRGTLIPCFSIEYEYKPFFYWYWLILSSHYGSHSLEGENISDLPNSEWSFSGIGKYQGVSILCSWYRITGMWACLLKSLFHVLFLLYSVFAQCAILRSSDVLDKALVNSLQTRSPAFANEFVFVTSHWSNFSCKGLLFLSPWTL